MTVTVSAERATTIQHHTASFKEGTASPLKALQRMLGLMAAASPLLQLGLLHMRPIQFCLKQRVPSAAWHHRRHRVTVTRACVSALACWRDHFWLKRGVILDTEHRRKVIMADTSNKGWGALCEGKPTFTLWSEEESGLHINCLEMLAVCQAGQFYLPDIRGHHVLIRSDSRSMVSHINHQGGLVLKRICTVATDLLVWAQNTEQWHGVIELVPILTSIFRGSTSEISKGNALSYFRNLGSLRYGNEGCVPGHAISCMLGCFLQRNLRCGSRRWII